MKNCSVCKIDLIDTSASPSVIKRGGRCRRCDAARGRQNFRRYKRCRETIKGRHRVLKEKLRIENVPKSDLLWSLNFYGALITDAVCHYCDSEKFSLGGFSLDRINNSAGHRCFNVVLCCPVCNSVKSNYFSYEEMKLLAPVLRAIREARG